MLSSKRNINCSLTLKYVQADEDYQKNRVPQVIKFIKKYNTEGTSISTTDYEGELRFIGATPANYVSFNNQKWRIIGVFDGKLKIIQDSIGILPWDTSNYDVNMGYGINQWGPSTYENGSSYDGADLFKLLNPGYENNMDLKCNSTITGGGLSSSCGDNAAESFENAKINNSLYWNAASGLCYNGGSYKTISCDFTSTGLSDEASRNMIDDHLWKIGSLDNPSANIWDGRIAADLLYKWERSSNSSKQCSNTNNCNDGVNRTVEWTGKVGLMYPSDWVYSTGGGSLGRSTCLSKTVGFVNSSSNGNWSNSYSTCAQDTWLNDSTYQLTITPRAHNDHSRGIFFIYSNQIYGNYAKGYYDCFVRPVVHLKSNVTITSGNGNKANPFVLSY